MSNTPIQEKPIQAGSPASGPMQSSQSVQPMFDPSVPKRLCFYKSGDHTFGGHRVVINARTFKTFDALLDALSKKVPLPFGVRTITTPRGTHLVKGLDDLQDGGSYLCSDQKRVKPVNLEEVNRRQVPWNMPRASSVGRRRRQGLQFASLGRADDSSGRRVKVSERVVVRTPRRLVVIKNKDPDVRRTIVLQKRTAPTFDALLDYLSQILQFPVLKLYSIDGRRIGGLAALILCSGFLVAGGNEPFRLDNHSFQRTNQTVQAMSMETGHPSMLQHQTCKGSDNHKSASSGRCSRNFSSSSEQYIINQINKSRTGSANSHTRSPEFNPTCMETCGSATAAGQRNACLLPQDDDIEKSFRVNRDGSMTVEMKVRLTIKEEEMLHWTTTVSRSSLSRRSLGASVAESGKGSPDSNIYVAKGTSDLCKDVAKKANQPLATEAKLSFNNVGEARNRLRCAQTPGSHRVMKEASFETVKMLTESRVQGSTLDHYSYLERTTEGDTMEGYCRIRHSSSSSSQPVPKPRKTIRKGNTTSLLKSSGVAEVLKIENDGTEVRETVMRIYERQGSSNNCLANDGADDTPLHRSPPEPQSHQSTASGPCSSSNDIDFSLQQPTADSLQRQKEEILSLSSEPVSPALQVANRPPSVPQNVAKIDKNSPTPLQKKRKPKKNSQSRLMDKKYQQSSADKHNSDTHAGKKSLSSTESTHRRLGEEMHTNTSARHGRESETLVRTSIREKNRNKAASKYNHNVNTPSVRPPMKKNVSDLLKLQQYSRKKTSSKHITMIDNKLSSTELAQQSLSKISLNRSPAEIQQYVENWLEEVIPDPVVYMVTSDEPQPPTKVVFQIGCESETEEKTETKEIVDYCQTPSDSLRMTASCLSVPLTAKEETPTNVSMAKVEPTHQQSCVWSKNSSESNNESASSQIHILSPKAKLKPVLQEICSSIHSIQMTSDQSSSPLDFSYHVASVFGSSCKSVLSFLSVMALRDSLTSDSTDSMNDSEAMLLLKFLQNISAVEDQDEQRASLIDLHSGASPQLMKCWMDFQTWREKLETESLTPKFQGTQESIRVQGVIVDQLMKEFNMPYDLRREISSALQQAPGEECTVLEPDKNYLESADVEQVVQDPDLKQFSDNVCIHESTNDNRSSWAGGTEEEPPKETGCESKEPNVSLVNTGEIQVREEKEESKEPLGEGEMKQKGSEEGTEEEAVLKEEGEEEELGKEGTKNKESEEKSKVIEEAGHKKIDERQEARQDGAEADLSKGNEEDVVEEDEDNEIEKITTEKSHHEDVTEEGARELVERNEEIDKDGEENHIEEEKKDKDDADENVEKEATEVLSFDNKEGNADMPELTTDKQQVGLEEQSEKLEENKEGTREINPEESVDQVEMVGGIKDEPESDYNLGCYQKPNPVVEVTANELDEGLKALAKDKESEDDLGCSLRANTGVEDTASPHEEGSEEIEEVHEKGGDSEEKDQDKIVENMQIEGTDVLSEMSNEEGVHTIPEPALHTKQVNLTDQTGKLEEEEEGTYPKEQSGEKVEEPKETPTETKSENGLGFQEPKPEVEGSSSAPSESFEEVVNEKDVAVEDEDQEKDDIEDNMEGESTEVLSEDNNVKGYGDDAVVPEPTADAEQENLTEQIEKLDEEDTCPEKESGEEDLTASIPDETLGTNPQKESDEKDNLNTSHGTESPLEYLSDERFEENKAHENKAEIHPPDRRNTLSHPVEISQELLDFVNSALQSSSLIFAYDDHGNIRVEADRAQITEIQTTLHPAIQRDCTYGSKCLQSPITSDLSDYRPESFESGPYQSQESEAITSENSEDASESFPEGLTERTNPESATSQISKSHSEGGSFSSSDSLTKGSREVLSCCKKGDNDQSSPTEQNPEPGNGILIDRGRWLLKENHLIRNSPPISEGMYNDLDTTSEDMGNSSEESQTHNIRQDTLLAAISSSDLEELAKPQPPRCSYFTMPHGSDSDPFLDDTSNQSRSKDTHCAKGRGFRVSPVTDTSKTLANRNCSLSSFASVEFKITDRKVHPEGGESTAGVEARGIPGDRNQSQDSADAMNVRSEYKMSYCRSIVSSKSRDTGEDK
ncbi:oxygen-regulated protein 1 [Hippocampus zosterae]|uniref:oxygen-regulated protein 1 n=1 Tax=Hippocampus zosterae TaxID=109293 RepID=UPI00223D2CC1|nr:oxygen-regulated protein 1 [Hippocampus zosterae]